MKQSELGPQTSATDPLTVEEFEAIRSLVLGREGHKSLRFVMVHLVETFGHRDEDPERAALCVLHERPGGQTIEAVVSLDSHAILSWRSVPDVQPAITPEEFIECERICRADDLWLAAIRSRGISDPDRCIVDPWSAGHYGLPDEQPGTRLVRALTWFRKEGDTNPYAHPIDNLVTTIDLNRGVVVSVEDLGVVPVPAESADFDSATIPSRTDLKPLIIEQPEGPSFDVRGHFITWQKWSLRVGFNVREGLTLHDIAYKDGDDLRKIIRRMSVSEMVVPYGDPRPGYFHRNAFDLGEYGIGLYANELQRGCDCLGHIEYLDAVVHDEAGRPKTLSNAICIHEEDAGLLWKHFDWRTDQSIVRRSRRLVISFMATVGNYDYLFYWFFYQDGSLELEIRLTGILSNGVSTSSIAPPWGRLVSTDIYAPIHQHFFNVRIHFDLDGGPNSLYEVNTESDPSGPENPFASAFRAVSRLLTNEADAQRVVNSVTSRYWKVANHSSKNAMMDAVGYRLVPGENAHPFAREGASVRKRAGFMTFHLWATPFKEEERYAAGDYPNQHPGGAGLPSYTAANRSIVDCDLVVWYTLGAHHVPRPEDWPVMPVTKIGFALRPDGFFSQNPALDVPDPRTLMSHRHGSSEVICLCGQAPT